MDQFPQTKTESRGIWIQDSTGVLLFWLFQLPPQVHTTAVSATVESAPVTKDEDMLTQRHTNSGHLPIDLDDMQQQ